MAVFHAKQHHGRRASVLLPTEHEVHQERNKGQREEHLRNGSKAPGHEIRYRAGGLDSDDALVVGHRAERVQGFRALAKCHDRRADAVRIFGQNLHEGGRLVVGEIGDPQSRAAAESAQRPGTTGRAAGGGGSGSPLSGAKMKASRVETRITTRTSSAT